MASRLSSFLAELKRRKVYRVAAVYAAVGVPLVLAAREVFEGFGIQPIVWQILVLFVVFGFPIALVLAWAYEVRPEEARNPEPSEGGHPPLPTRGPTPMIPPTAERKSIVVLPFDNMSPDPGDAYFADGLTEEIITNLSHIHSLRVISRNSALALKGTQKRTREIAEELDVHFVLEGSVRKAGDDLRITAQLIDAASDEHLWAEKYDGVLEDVFGMQEAVAGSIVDQLALRLSPKEEKLLSARPIRDVSAYQYYLRARVRIWEGTPEALANAADDLQTALRLVGDNPLLFAGLGYVYFTKANIGIEQDEAVKNAVQNAERALELDPDCAEAEVVLGVSHGSFFGELRVGLEHLQRARQLDPNNPDAVFWLLIWSLTLGWMDQARELAELIVPLDPLSGLSYNAKADYLMFVGDFGLAADFHKLCFDMLPDSPLFLAFYAWGLAFAGRIDELGTALEGGIPEDPSGMTRMAFLFEAAANKDQQKVLSLISTDLEHYCHRDPWWSYFLSTILANVSERDRALGWLERAVDLGFINFPFLANTDPFLANLREEPPFQAIMERVKHEWENSEV